MSGEREIMENYRVDIFDGKEHKKYYFETEEEAIKFASKKSGIKFLLRHICDGKYDVVKQLPGTA